MNLQLGQFGTEIHSENSLFARIGIKEKRGDYNWKNKHIFNLDWLSILFNALVALRLCPGLKFWSPNFFEKIWNEFGMVLKIEMMWTKGNLLSYWSWNQFSNAFFFNMNEWPTSKIFRFLPFLVPTNGVKLTIKSKMNSQSFKLLTLKPAKLKPIFWWL